jgi:hypothetical protein
MLIALLNFGQPRAYEEVMEENIKHILAAFPSCEIHIYILTNRKISGGFYEDTEDKIRGILYKYNITIKLFAFWEDLVEFHSTDEIIGQYVKGWLGEREYFPSSIWMGNMWYRRYILGKLFDSVKGSIVYNYCVSCRLFDMEIKLLRQIMPVLEPGKLFYAVDSFFIGSPSVINTLLKFGRTTENYKDFEWTAEFTEAFRAFDYTIATKKDTLCSETQVFQYIRKTFSADKQQNIRWDPVQQSESHSHAFFYVWHVRAKPIPKKILQIALGSSYKASLPLDMLKGRLLEINRQYEYVLMDDEGATKFLSEHFPRYISLYNSLERVQYKSDLLRYLYLYRFGGYYADIDTLPVLSLDAMYDKTMLAKCFFFQGAHTDPVKGVYEIQNGFMGCVKGMSLFLELAEEMVSEPNPADYRKNMKNLYRGLHKRMGGEVKLYENCAGFYLFNQVGVEGKYYMVYRNEVLAIGNGHGYPFMKV